jgi:hypothetical protein
LKALTIPYRKLAIAQLALALLLLPLIALWPRPGMAVLILPLPGRIAPAGLWARQQGLPVLGRGIASSSLVMIGQHQYSPFSALSAGALMIAAPGSLCQSSPNLSKDKP